MGRKVFLKNLIGKTTHTGWPKQIIDNQNIWSHYWRPSFLGRNRSYELVCLDQTLNYEPPWAHRGWRMFNYLHQWKTWHLLNVLDSSESYKKPLSSLNLNHWLGNQKEYKYPKVYRKFFTIISFFKGSKQINTLEKKWRKNQESNEWRFLSQNSILLKTFIFTSSEMFDFAQSLQRNEKKKENLSRFPVWKFIDPFFFVWTCHACIIYL